MVALGRPGLEPGTDPESFRGCSIKSILRLQDERGEPRILFVFEGNLQLARFGDRRQLSGRNELEMVAEPPSRMITAASMFFDTTVQILRRSDIMTARRTAQNVNPSHKLHWVGRDSNPEPTP